MLLDEGVDGLLVKRCEYLYVLLCVIIAYVKPELVESVRCGAVAVKPDVSGLCLAELLAVSLCNERTSEGISLCLAAECGG